MTARARKKLEKQIVCLCKRLNCARDDLKSAQQQHSTASAWLAEIDKQTGKAAGRILNLSERLKYCREKLEAK